MIKIILINSLPLHPECARAGASAAKLALQLHGDGASPAWTHPKATGTVLKCCWAPGLGYIHETEIFLPIPSALHRHSCAGLRMHPLPNLAAIQDYFPPPPPPTHRNGSANATFCGGHDAGHAGLRGVHSGISYFRKKL